ncbi:MAG: hypothetical protein ACLFVU_07310 [Phycisphaerae bacterium]
MPNPTTTVDDRAVIRIARLLDQAGEYNRRAKLGPRQHSRGLYKRKDAILQQVLIEAAGQFVIDSILREEPLILGVSHRHTARRFHLRPDRLSPETRAIIKALPRTGTAADEEDSCAGGAS